MYSNHNVQYSIVHCTCTVRVHTDVSLHVCTVVQSVHVQYVLLSTVQSVHIRDGKTRPGPRAGPGRAGPGLRIQARGPYGPKRAETGLMIFI